MSNDVKLYTPFDFLPKIVTETYENNRVIISRAGLAYLCLGTFYIFYSYFNWGFKAIDNYRKTTSKYSIEGEIDSVRKTLYDVSWLVLLDAIILPYSVSKDIIANLLPYMIVKTFNYLYGKNI
jgi:hypothetical protein